MGGHGGLNILPQKRWHGEPHGLLEPLCHSFPSTCPSAHPHGPPHPLCAVYNQDNRLKVSQDEEKAKAIEDAIQEKAETAEREYRHQLLLQRSQVRLKTHIITMREDNTHKNT